MDELVDPRSLVIGVGDRFVAWGRCQMSPGGAVWFGPALPSEGETGPWAVPPARSVPADGVRFDELEGHVRRGALRAGFGQLVGTWERDRVHVVEQSRRDLRTREVGMPLRSGSPPEDAEAAVVELRDHADAWGLLRFPSGPSAVLQVELVRVTAEIAAWAADHTPGLVVLRPWLRPDFP